MPFTDRIVENPRTFTIQNNPDGTVTLIPAPGTILQEGTPVNATNLNAIEESIATHEEDATTAHGINTKVEKPTTATADRIAVFDTNQNKLKDGGKAIADLLLSSVTAGDYVIHSSTALKYTLSETLDKVKESKIGIGGQLRIKFTGRCTPGGSARVHKNGVAVGTTRILNSSTVEFIEDISGWAKDDLVQIYAQTNNGGVASADITNFYICIDGPFFGATLIV